MRALLLFLVIPIVISCPQDMLKGKVLDKLTGEVLAGVNVYITGTQYGTSTNEDGYFDLTLPAVDTFSVGASLIGYTHIRIPSDSIPASELVIYLERKLIQLADITVTESRPQYANYNLMKIPVERAIRTAGNMNDISRSLAVLPGFAKPYDYRNDLIVRGGSSSENLFLIDGMTVPSINHFGNQGFTGGPVSYIDPGFLENISLSTGGFTSVYGDKLSSVVDLELRESNAQEFTNSLSISGTQFSINSEYAFSSNLNYIFSLRRSFLDPLFRIYGFFYYPEYYDLLGKINLKLNQLNSLSFLFIGTNDAIKFFDSAGDIRKDNPRAVGSNQSRSITGVSFKSTFRKGSINVSLSRNDFNYTTIPNHFFSNDSYEAENNLKADLLYNISRNSFISIGTSLSVVQFNIDAEFYNYRSSYHEMFNAVVKGTRTFYKNGSYINYSHKINSLEMNAGVRLDYFSPLKSEKTISPRLSFNYKAGERISLELKTGIYRQSPSYVWLAGDSRNTRLKNLRADHLIIGMDYSLADEFNIKTETYIKNYSNYPVSIKRPYLVLANTGAEFTGTDNNFASYGIEPLLSRGSGTSKGIEFSMHHNNRNIPLSADANLSLSQTYFTGLDGIKRAGSYDQTWVLNLMADYKFDDIWSANIRYFYASGVPYTPFDDNGAQSALDFNKLRMPPVHSLDLRLEMRLYSSSSSMVYLDIKNLYNRENLYYFYYDTTKKKVSHDPAIRILPSIGINVIL